MKYNYPIKYAAMPIIEQVGWCPGLNELERKYDVVCYIVSKCYLLSSKIKYNENGKSEREFEVAFPYQNLERVKPSTNSSLVDDVFDTYEEALEFATKKNKKLCENTWVYLPYTDDLEHQISKKIKEFNDKLSKYKMLEQQILINTSDLDQSNVRKLDNLIIDDNGKPKVFFGNLYEYLKLSTYSNFIIYSISQEEYDKLANLINSNDIPHTSKIFQTAIPILYHQSIDENIMVIDQAGKVLYYINKWEHLIANDEKIPPVELKNIGAETEILFTTEKLEDIVLSFDVRKYINPDEIQSQVLVKK